MRSLLPAIGLILVFGCNSKAQTTDVLINAHAHNDYEHARPLLEALENGFISVEADVFSINGNLWVSHEEPEILDPNRTLETLYLKPLKDRIENNAGNVYPGYNDFFYLMIDIKTPAEDSYPVLRNILSQYSDIISMVTDSIDQAKPVKVFISGHHGRPYDEILDDSIKYAGLDGRPEELGRGVPSAYMPVISQNYKKYLSWDGINGEPGAQEIYRLSQMIEKAHAENKKVRLWAAPDHEQAWAFLLNLGVDLINTDDLKGLNKFLTDRD